MLASMWKLLVQKILIKFKNFSTPNCGRLGVPGWDSFLILGGYGAISKITEKEQFRVLSQAVIFISNAVSLRTRNCPFSVILLIGT